MESATKLLKNTLLIAAGSIILRLCALLFQSYLAAKVGAGQLGFYGIVSSVGVVFATIAVSGVRFAVTRLVSERCSKGTLYPHSLMKSAFSYAMIFGFASGMVMFFSAEVLSYFWVMNSDAEGALKIIAFSMPFISTGAAAEGYFVAKQKVFRSVSAEISSQLIRIAFIVLCFEKYSGKATTDILAAGSFVGEVSLSLILTTLYFFESRGKKEKEKTNKNFSTLAKTALPLAVSAYMRTGLSSMGQIIIPHGLKRSGMGAGKAFATYGIIGQMAFPVMMFPAALLNALGEVLVPRLTGAQTRREKISICYIVNRALRVGTIFSFGIMGIMLFFSGELGQFFYSSNQAGRYIRVFAPLLPVIYIDCVTDGCLKGLGQQVHSMMYNVMEGVLNVTLLMLLLPKMSIAGYIVVMYIKEIFNAVLSIRRLCKVSCVDKNIAVILCAFFAVVLSRWFLGIVLPKGTLWVAVTLYICFYITMLYILNAVTRDDLRWIISLMRPCSSDTLKEKTKKPVRGVDKRLSHW